MIDTVTRTTLRSLLPAVATAVGKNDSAAFPPGWSFSCSQRSGSNSRTASSDWKLTGYHEPTGLFVHGVPYELRGYTISLPGVLHGFNGVQLKDDLEINASLDRVHAILGEVSAVPGQTETFRRLDVAINLSHAQPERLVSALRNSRHPWIRRETEKYATGSIRYPGVESVFTAYWKQPPSRAGMRRKGWKTPQVLRLELQLKTAKKIAQFLGRDEETLLIHLPPRSDIYLAFREFMTAFQRREQRADKCSMPALLALCESQGVALPGGQGVMDWHRASVGASAHGKMRSKVAAIAAEFLAVDWSELLPANTFPETVDVRLNGSTALVPPSPIIYPARPVPTRFGCPPSAYPIPSSTRP